MSGSLTLLCGACGTELERRGVPTPLPLWSAAALLHAPDVVRAVHLDHVRAGARILTADTFRTVRRTLERARCATGARELVGIAVRLAREAVALGRPEGGVRVAGSVAPLEDCFRPDLVPDDAALADEHLERARHLVEAGADLALVETMNTVREAVAALAACRRAGLPAAVSFTCTAGGRVLSGESIAEAARAVRPFRPLAVGVNCCPLPVATEAVIAFARCAEGTPVVVYANGMGVPDETSGWRFEPGRGADRAAYLAAARGWYAAGARWIGGCCGTTPEYVADLRAAHLDVP